MGLSKVDVQGSVSNDRRSRFDHSLRYLRMTAVCALRPSRVAASNGQTPLSQAVPTRMQ